MARKALIGLSDFHYALLTSGTDTLAVAPQYETPVKISGAIRASYNPNGSISTLFSDDGPSIAADTIGEVELSLDIEDLSQEDEAAIFGHTISNGILIKKPTDTSPELAFGFKAKMSNGQYKFLWFLKGKFSKPSMDHETKGAQINYQTPKFVAKFVQREYDGNYLFQTRQDAVGYTSDIGSNWFTNVATATPDTTAPTVSVSPADGATSVAVTANVVWTFSKAIRSADVNSGNFFVNKADGTAVSGTLSIGTSNTVVTFDPASNLSATSDYIAIATSNVRDIAGNHLAANSVTNFTTA